ncbi:hypothetical protein [Flavobacterium columnare]|uniref:hypothetical protein n=1 Tax=Flavobacterium columnare TaxID=996 RepID=UPI000B5B7569|nr:hypothetical protein B0A56_00675 [Flavobacterium columnare NBRC 100251 = ATCC 23463]
MKDFVLDKDNDLMFANGDFFVANSDQQHLELILNSQQGEWKENPDLGVNLIKSQSGLIDRFLKRNIKVQLEADGFDIEILNIGTTGIELKGQYGNTST